MKRNLKKATFLHFLKIQRFFSFFENISQQNFELTTLIVTLSRRVDSKHK